jgi:FMN-dependent oxidoreductase (nitrilotriacetate monooxygenase family)
MNCVSHIQHGLWGRPDTRQLEYRTLDPWVELAQILERGRFDALFLADVTGIYDNYQGGPEAALRNAMQVPVNDPSYLIPAMAQVTEHLGLAFTGSILAEHPYTFARRLSTLDHLTGGRVGWNIVTSYLSGAARNLGLDELPRHDTRYDQGDDFMEVIYKLLEASWEDDAVVADAARGIYTDPTKVHSIDHEGPWYRVPGPHVCEPSPQRTPVLFQAGSSERGREFAARHAECAFVVASRRSLTKLATDIRARAGRYGRRPDDIKFFLALSPVVGGTEAEARAKEADLLEQLSIEGGLVHMSGNLGADLGLLDLDRPIADFDFNAVTGVVKNLAESTPDKTMTFGDLAARQMSGSFLVGAPEQIADKIESFAMAGADGFNLVYSTTPGTFVDFIDGVVPVLQERGLMQREYAPGTFREKLFGSPRLPPRHPGGALRLASSGRS